MDKQKIIANFIAPQIHMVITTVDSGNNPEAALVGFANRNDLTIIFGTNMNSRKYKNIAHNPHVAIVFGANEGITVQYEGTISEFSPSELAEYKQIYFTKTPSSQKYEHQEGQIYLKVTPLWIRYTNYNDKPETIFELSFP